MSIQSLSKSLTTAGVKHTVVAADKKTTTKQEDTLTRALEDIGYNEFRPNTFFVEVCSLTSNRLEITSFVKGNYNFYIDILVEFGGVIHVSVASRGNDAASAKISGSYTDNVGFDSVDTMLRNNGQEFKRFLKTTFDKIKHLYISK